jgi:hypothetical protein
VEEHRKELDAVLSHRAAGTLPVVILVSAGEDEKLTGFLEVGLRAHADGCEWCGRLYVSISKTRNCVVRRFCTAIRRATSVPS